MNGWYEMEKDISKLIIQLLTKRKEKTSTYEVAKGVKVSWSTANIHCYKLKSEGEIDGELEVAKIGSGKKMLWWIPKK
jgi:Mn-dependent DtxR family transcriptional regulator